MSVPVAYPLTIYYDASCPLCATEMEGLKQRDTMNRLRLVDCSTELDRNVAAAPAGMTRADLMRVIHARDANGAWLRGVDVFGAVYGAVGLCGWARLWSDPWLRPWWNAIYPWVANNRQLLSKLGLPWLWERLVVLGSTPRVRGTCQSCDGTPVVDQRPRSAKE